jgi:hypothetical protein
VKSLKVAVSKSSAPTLPKAAKVTYKFSGNSPLVILNASIWKAVCMAKVLERRCSVSIFEEGSRLGLKCLLLSYFRVGDKNEAAGAAIATAVAGE